MTHTITIEQKKVRRGPSWLVRLEKSEGGPHLRERIAVKLPRGVQRGPVDIRVKSGLYQWGSWDGKGGMFLVNGQVHPVSKALGYELLYDLERYLQGAAIPPEPVTGGIKMRLMGRSKLWCAKIEGVDDGRFDLTFLRTVDGGRGWRSYSIISDGVYTSHDQRDRRYWWAHDEAIEEIGVEDARALLSDEDVPF